MRRFRYWAPGRSIWKPATKRMLMELMTTKRILWLVGLAIFVGLASALFVSRELREVEPAKVPSEALPTTPTPKGPVRSDQRIPVASKDIQATSPPKSVHEQI